MTTMARRTLKARMEIAGMNGKQLAKAIGITPVSVYRKLNGDTTWSMREANLVCMVLGIKDLETRARIFLNDDAKGGKS